MFGVKDNVNDVNDVCAPHQLGDLVIARELLCEGRALVVAQRALASMVLTSRNQFGMHFCVVIRAGRDLGLSRLNSLSSDVGRLSWDSDK